MISVNLDNIPNVDSAKIKGPIIVKNSGDVSGPDVFKITIGLTNLNPSIGIVEVCLTSLYQNHPKVCNLVDVSKEYSNDFPLQNCSSCIVSGGTYVFPAKSVPTNSEIEGCVYSYNSLITNCKKITNNESNRVEDLILKIS
jgi:hypothetical protein